MPNYNFNDLLGQRFGRLVVIAKTPKRKHKKIIWLCQCDCGNHAEVMGVLLTRGTTQSCGCLHHDTVSKMMSSNLRGKRFGRLVVIEKTSQRANRKIVWKCQCDCGNTIEVPTNYLTSNDTKSCGCLLGDMVGESNPNWRGGISTENNLVRTSERYQTWRTDVFKRDRFRCKKCKQKGGDLAAHHIKGFRTYKSLRFDVDNGATLCKPCHLEFHKQYGFHHCDGSDFYKWIGN